jgi:acyl-CoA synthetase (NDP forming)
MFGLGGIYTETLKDVSFRLAPIRENVAEEMIHDIRTIKLLQGVRGEPPSDLAAVAECLLRLSQFVTDHPRISELDINPCWSTRAAKASWSPMRASFWKRNRS